MLNIFLQYMYVCIFYSTKSQHVLESTKNIEDITGSVSRDLTGAKRGSLFTFYSGAFL
jgi:hypothetical protein